MMKEAKDKEKPFNYNGTLILGPAAHFLSDYAAAEKFYEHLVDARPSSRAGRRSSPPYEGLIDLYCDAEAVRRRRRDCARSSWTCAGRRRSRTPSRSSSSG